jgi:membrane protease YdiL (CAAX protease family)
MVPENALKARQAPRLLLFALVWIGGLSIFLFGGNTFSLFPTNRNPLYEWGLALVLLALVIWVRLRRPAWKYWIIAYAFFVAAFANAVNLYLGNWLGAILPAARSQMELLAVDKLAQAIPIVLVIILLTWLAGDDLGSIFLKRGNLRQGLLFGWISFGVFAALFALIAVLQAGAPASQGLGASGLSLDTLLAALPWILVFVFTNGFMEELWFRGLFLGKLRPFLGAAGAVLVTALVFGMTHLGATYVTPAERLLFPAIVVTLGLVNGYVMQKTDSLWGSVLFHAGYDLLVIIPVLVSNT